MSIDTKKLESDLKTFVQKTDNVNGAAIVTPDGLALAADLPGGMDEERVSAMTAAMLSLGERIGKELSRGEIEQIYVEGTEGYGVLTSCGPDAVFLVLASIDVKKGVLMFEIKQVLGDLKAAMG